MIRIVKAGVLTLVAALGAAMSPAVAQPAEPKPLFASDATIHLSIRTDLSALSRANEALPATLTVEGDTPETHQIQLSPRGVSRRRRDICTFPPLRVQLPARPAAGLFQGQRRLKLVTHCRRSTSHDQFVLLEYAAYRLYNAITPRSFNVRLARIDYYRGDASSPNMTRLGFFIEDVDDAAERNGMVEVERGDFPPSYLNAVDTARVALFQYMVGNLDWAVQAGPPGEDCCHNTKPIGPSETATSNLVSLPYDFDQTGIVSAPYASPPAQLRVSSVRQRVYRGFCSHNAETRTEAVRFLAARPQLEAVLESIPEFADRTRSRALSYLGSFFVDIATPEAVDDNLIEDCL